MLGVKDLTRLEDRWMDFILEILPTKLFIFLGIRKMVKNKTLVIEGKDWNTGIEMKYHDMGYGVRSTKEQQLRRNYLNEEKCMEVNRALKRRIFKEKKKQSTLQLILQNKPKKGSSRGGGDEKTNKHNQGFCMMGLVVSHFNIDKKDMIYITINYRTTEMICKFLADLKFLHEVVIPMLLKDIDIPIKEVRFNFATVYLSVMFLPVVYQFIYPHEFLKGIDNKDPRFFKTAMTDLRGMVHSDHISSYRTKANMTLLFRRTGLQNNATLKFIKKHTGE